MPNNKIRTSELDFDAIKENLKEYLRGQTEFSDYDFEGSALSVLLDVLAYNTHYNALYTNLAVNEAFLDSASKRSSVVSKAKELGYIPQSAKSATAVVDIVFINNNIDAPPFITLEPSTPFTARVNNRNFTFINLDSLIAFKTGNQYIFQDVILKEGTFVENTFIADDRERQSFVIPNSNIDTTTLRVLVQDNQQTTSVTTFTHAENMLKVNKNSTVYFLKEVDGGLFEIEFGNNNIGKSLEPGNIVTVRYLVCNGSQANSVRSFVFGGSSSGIPFVTTKVPSYGGAAPESIDNIRWNAPRSYTTQDRCVTVEDYQTIISAQYPNAESINVWGGDQNVPKAFGRVFIAIKPFGSETLADNEKDFILNEILGPRRITTVFPSIVDPTYLRVEVNTTFYYDRSLTTKSALDLTTAVKSTIEDYNRRELNRFGSILKFSALSTAIDSTDPAITNSITTVKINRDIEPRYNILSDYIVDVGNPIHNGGDDPAIISTGIRVINVPRVAYIEDVPVRGAAESKLRMYYFEGTTKIPVRDVGTVNYQRGEIRITNLLITGLEGTAFNLKIRPQSYDVASVRNQIVTIPSSTITVTPQIITNANDYRFTSSRS